MKSQRIIMRMMGVIAASLTIVASFGYFVIWPAWLHNQEALDAIQAKLVDQDITKSQQQKLPTIRSQAEHIQEDFGALSVTVDPNDPIRWVHELEQLAKDTGNTITIETDDSLTPSAAKAPPVKATSPSSSTDDSSKPASSPPSADSPSKAPSKVPSLRDELPKLPGLGLKLTVQGDYHSVTLFLKKLEMLSFMVDVLNVSLTKNDKDKMNNKTAGMMVSSVATPGQPRNLFQSTATSGSDNTANTPQEFRPLKATFGVVLAISQ